MVLKNASLLSSAMPKLYLCSKCSPELQRRMYFKFFLHENTRNCFTLQRRRIKKKPYIVVVYSAGFISVTWLGDGVGAGGPW